MTTDQIPVIDDETHYAITCGCGRYAIRDGYGVPRVRLGALHVALFGTAHAAHGRPHLETIGEPA